MFLDFYQLREQPFGVTPDPKYLYLSPTHREALASLLYGVKCGRGFMALIARPGMGKTTLLFSLLQRLRFSARTAFLFQTQCRSLDLLRQLMADLGLGSETQDIVEMHQKLNRMLAREAEAGHPVVVIIDEAQNLDEESLESVRLLSDFETPSAKLLQVILAGQPPLADKLASPRLAQLYQRLSIIAHLEPFTPEETDQYINHRLHLSGYQGKGLFDSQARALIARYSEGIPRTINNLCFNALSIGCGLQRPVIDAAIVQEAAADLDIAPLRSEPRASGTQCRNDFAAIPITPPLEKSREVIRRPRRPAAAVISAPRDGGAVKAGLRAFLLGASLLVIGVLGLRIYQGQLPVLELMRASSEIPSAVAAQASSFIDPPANPNPGPSTPNVQPPPPAVQTDKVTDEQAVAPEAPAPVAAATTEPAKTRHVHPPREKYLGRIPMGVLSVVTVPSGAAISIDGVSYGTTPLEARLRAGEHTFRVEMDGFPAYQRTVDVPEGMLDGLLVKFTTIGPDAGSVVIQRDSQKQSAPQGTVTPANSPGSGGSAPGSQRPESKAPDHGVIPQITGATKSPPQLAGREASPVQ